MVFIHIVSSLKAYIVSVKKDNQLKVILHTDLCKDTNQLSFRIPKPEKLTKVYTEEQTKIIYCVWVELVWVCDGNSAVVKGN